MIFAFVVTNKGVGKLASEDTRYREYHFGLLEGLCTMMISTSAPLQCTYILLFSSKQKYEKVNVNVHTQNILKFFLEN
jgi:hypothetical protein